jgi:hypothetical protein
MANILALLHKDGTTALSKEIRGGVEQYVVDVDLVFNETGGEGQSEFIVRNISSDNTALNVNISTSQHPLNNQTNNVLSQQWDYKPLGVETWNNQWRDSINIEKIPPGQFINVRTRVLATANADPAIHKGALLIKYLRSSI